MLSQPLISKVRKAFPLPPPLPYPTEIQVVQGKLLLNNITTCIIDIAFERGRTNTTHNCHTMNSGNHEGTSTFEFHSF